MKTLYYQLLQARQSYDAGLTTILDVREIKADVDSAKAECLLAEGRLSVSFQRLEVITGNKHSAVLFLY